MIGLKRSKYLSLMIVLAMLFTIVAPGVAWAAAPVIATVSTIANAAVDPSVTVTGTGFKAGIADGDLTVGFGATGLTAFAVTYVSATELTVAFTGTAAAGDVTIQAKTSAYDPAAAEASNTLTVTVPAAPTYALTLTGDNISSVPGAGNLTAGTSVTVTVAPAAGKQVATFTVGGVDQKAALAGGTANQYTFNMPAAATTVVVTYEDIPGHAANITTTNVLIVGNYAFELNNASYTLNNYLTAAGTVYNNGTRNEIYYYTGSVWYDLVAADELGQGLVQAVEVDPSNINGNGLYTHMNMTAL